MVTYRQVLKNRRFFAVWLAQFVSSFGDWLALLALMSMAAFRKQGSAEEVSYLLIAFVMPVAVLGPIAGVFVDRWNLKATMIGSDLLRAAIALLLILPGTLPPLYALVFALSTVSCFFVPAQTAAIPQIVAAEELLVANAANTQTLYLTRIVSPALAGLLVGHFGEAICFALDSATFLVSAALLASVSFGRREKAPQRAARRVLGDLLEGLRFIGEQRKLTFLATAMILTLFAVGFFDALIPIYVRDILLGTSFTFGILMSLSGAGTVVGAWLIGRLGQGRSELKMIAAGILALGVTILGFTVMPYAAPALAISLLFGTAVAAIMVSAQTLVQKETPADLLGRAGATLHSLITLAQLIGFGSAGALASRIGLRNVFYLVAVALVVVGGASLLSNRPRSVRAAAA